MHIKIYFQNKPLFLCNAVDSTINEYMHHDDAVFIDELNVHTVKTMIHEMEQPEIHAGIFYHSDIEALKRAVWKKFTVIQAGGGLVENENGEVLLIFRRGYWDLPKGKLDKGETLEQCAVREVREETGLQKITLLKHFATTYHTYHEGARFILKESYWYRMKANGDQAITPQKEEDITAIKWVAVNEISSYIKLSYPSVGDVLQMKTDT